MKDSTLKIRSGILLKYPGIQGKVIFRELEWDSLQWASFLSDLFAEIAPGAQNILLEKFFIENDFEILNLNELLRIIDELE